MDLYYPNLYEKMRGPNRLLRCPRCGSWEVERDRCNDCGRIFHFDLLGTPLGERSFIQLAHHFYQLPLANQRKERKGYLRTLRRREQVLQHYFQTTAQQATEPVTVAIFQVELALLEEELRQWRIPSWRERWQGFWQRRYCSGLLRPVFLLQVGTGLLLVNLCALYFR